MSRFSRFLTFLALAALSARAQTATPASDPGHASGAVEMQPFVVSDDLDRAREEIAPSLGATQYSVDASQLSAEALGASQSFNQVLLRVPGVAQDSFGQVHLRGEHANLQFRINDVMLPEGISGFGQDLDTPFVRSVSVVTGSLPAQYGFRTAGIVDIHTQTGASLRHAGDLTLFAGSFGTLRTSADAAGAAGHLSDFAVASAEENALGVENPTPSASALHDHTRQFKVFNDLSWLIDDSSRLTFMLSGSFARFQIPNSPGQTPAYALPGGATAPDSAALDENQREDNAYAILAYQKSTDVFSTQVSAFSRVSLVDFTPDLLGDLAYNGVASQVRRAVVVDGVEIGSKWALTDAHTLRAGLVVTATNASTRTRSAVFPADALGNQISTTPLFIADNGRKLGWLEGAYVQDEWTPLDRLTVNAGLRADASRAYVNESQLSPRFNVVWHASASTDLHAGYSRYFTPPPLELVQPRDLALFAATTNAPAVAVSSPVLSERADYLDAGVSHHFTGTLTGTLDAYDKFAKRQLDEGQFGAALIYSPFNFRTGHIEGVETSLTYDNGSFSAYSNLALSRATGRGILSGEFQFSPDELAAIAANDVHLDHDQTLTGSSGLSYRAGPLLVYAELLYGSGLRRGFANTGKLPAYHPVNLGAERDVSLGSGQTLRLRLDVVNVFDERYELRDGSGIGVGAPQYGQRRGIFGTLSYVF